jgi:hypothetical protein
MSDDPWVSPVHTTSADENEAYASHPLHAEVAALTAELDRLKYRVVELKSVGQSYKNQRDTLAAQLAQAETVIEKAAAYVKEHRWMLNGLAQWRDEGTKIGPGNDVRLDLAAAVDAYQATPATTERDHETPLDIYWAVERDSGRPLPSDAIVPRTTEREGAGDDPA